MKMAKEPGEEWAMNALGGSPWLKLERCEERGTRLRLLRTRLQWKIRLVSGC